MFADKLGLLKVFSKKGERQTLAGVWLGRWKRIGRTQWVQIGVAELEHNRKHRNGNGAGGRGGIVRMKCEFRGVDKNNYAK